MSWKTLEAQRLYMAKWRRKNRKKTRAYMAAYREAHRQDLRDYHQAWRTAHPEQQKASRDRYKLKHPAVLKRLWRRYRHREKQRNKALVASLPCLECGMHHTIERRVAVLRRLLPCHTSEIHAAWECVWGPAGKEHRNSGGAQMLRRDLRRIGAVCSTTKGEYELPERSAACAWRAA